MKILVTGGCGFVGINLAEELLARGESIVLLDRHGLPSGAKTALHQPNPRVAIVIADVRDPSVLRSAISDFGVQRVIHTAVITADIQRESREPNEIIDVNIRGTVNVLEAAKSTRCDRVIFVSSGAAYGQTHDVGAVLQEDISPSRPDNIYGMTKFSAEEIGLRLGALWGLKVLCVRLGSVCGPWEFDTGVRDLLSPQLQVARLAVRGNVAVIPEHEVRRDWIYSRDVAAGLAAILTAPVPHYSRYHLSSGLDWSGSFVHWCDSLKSAFPKFSWRIAEKGEKPNVNFLLERDRSPMDIARIVQDIGFRPRFGPREAYSDYRDWVQEHWDFLINADQSM